MSGYTYRAGRQLSPFEDNLLRRAKHAEDEAARAEMRAKHAEAKLEYAGRISRLASKAAAANVRHVVALEAARDRTRGLLATLRKERAAARPEDEAEAVRLTRELAKSEEVRMAAQEALQQEREAHAERMAKANRRAALAAEERAHLQARLDKAKARARSLEDQEEEVAALQARLDGIKSQHREAMKSQAAAWCGILGRAEEEQAKERAALQARLAEAEARARSLEEQAAAREDLLADAEARVRSMEVKTEYTTASDTRTYGHLVELEARVRELAGALDDALIIARDATAERDQARAKAVEHEHAALQARQKAATAAAERDRAESAARQRDEDVWETQRMIHSLDQANAPASGGATDLPPHSGDVIVAPEGTSLEDMHRAWREHLAANQAKGYKLGGLIGANTEDDNQDGEQQQ